MRNLVTIRTIQEILPIHGADQIELAKIDGWQCVVKKNEFKPFDSCLFFEVDSFFPETDERFAFLAGRGVQTNGDGSKGYRLRTVKLRKQLSQGLALPVSQFSEILDDSGRVIDPSQDADLAEMLGITKWEPALPAQLSGQTKGTFPAFLKKTDQERIQNMPWILEDDGEWEVTQKLNGSSCTIYWRDGEFGVCSRNQELKETEGNSFWHVANKYNVREMLNQMQLNIAIQGELMGPGVQGNSAGLSSHDFVLFDIWLIDESRHATLDERIDLFEPMRKYGLKHAPLLNVIDLGVFKEVSDILRYADERIDILNPKNQPEGVVFKRMDGTKTFKVISNKFLMGEKQ